MKTKLLTLTVAGTSLATALNFHTITDLDAPNMVDGNPGGNPLTNIIEGVGVGFDSAEPHNRLGGTWYSDAPGGFPSDYIVSNAGDEIIILDLGADTTIHELSYWGYSDGNGNGLREFSLRFATDAEGGDPNFLGDESYGTSITFNPLFEAAHPQTPRQSFGFGQPITARYVEVLAISNYFNFVVGGDRLGIGEFAFAQPSAVGVPDVDPPASVALDLDPDFVTTHDIALPNTGDTDLMVTGVSFSGPNAAAFSVNSTLPLSIATFLNGPVEIEFDPDGLGGAISATMTVTTNDPDEASFDVALSGTLPALGPDLSVASPQELVVDGTITETFFIDVDNVGGTDLTISGVTFSGDDAGAFSVVSLPGVIGPGGFDGIEIQLDPTTLDEGAMDVTMHITSNDDDTPVTDVILNGGLAVAFHAISFVETNTVNFFDILNLYEGEGAGYGSQWPHNGPGSTWVTDAPNGGGWRLL